ncbi:S9 family peptidase [Peribacillus butanolivorans]|uniref:S9 family peptidase n=1 Tax=Peribacillus butanolivorans TaxID=421767 RepID=UPI00167F9F65|nr:S9 family peptidase [Peribacillus butanolivorans]QNU06270.1 S9 family peptidase [Peribacillus butanolivorans]
MKEIGIKSYLSVGTVSNPVYDPNSNNLIFIADYSGLPQVWAKDFDISEPTRISFTNERITFVKYLNSSSQRGLLIGMDVCGNEKQQLFLLKSDGLLIPLTNSPDHKHEYGGQSPDGKWIAWSSNRRHPAFFDIYIQNVETLEIQMVLSKDGLYSSIMWSPDCNSLLIRKTNSQLDNDLGLLNLDTGEMNWLTDHQGEASYKNPHFSKDGNHLYLLTNQDREFFGLAIIDLSTKHITWLEVGQWDFEGLAMSKDHSKLAFSINEGGISRGILLDLKSSALYTWKTPMGMITNLTFSPDNQKLAYVFNGPTYPSDIWQVDLKKMKTERLTQSLQTKLLENKLIEPILISFKSFDNLQIPAFYFKPNTQSEKIPVILYVHGGPESQIRAVFNPFLQYFLSLGYAIITPNVRGSTGYGKTYTHLDDVRKRMDSVRDLVSLVDWLKQEGSTDPNRVAIMGGSYGGFMVLAAISHYPELWSAAIDLVGISSFRTFLKKTSPWRRKLREVEYGTIEKDGNFYDLIDPLNQTDRITSPLMVLHGANDPRVPIEESEQIINKLMARNHPVKFICFENEGHSIVKLNNKITAYTAIAHFLNHYIGK